jgi:hypothetical protein
MPAGNFRKNLVTRCPCLCLFYGLAVTLSIENVGNSRIVSEKNSESGGGKRKMVSGTVEAEFILKGDRATPESFSGALQALFTDDGGIITIPTAELNKASQPRPFIVVIPSEDMEELRRQAQHGRLKFVPQFSVVESLTYALEAQDKYTAGILTVLLSLLTPLAK